METFYRHKNYINRSMKPNNPYLSAPSDPDANAFILAAGLTNQTQKTAVTTLVISLKSAGLWTKMVAIYPIVGGTASSHKFNLKNPLDADGAFRMAFYGGLTHSATGILPNGTNGYAALVYLPGSGITATSVHLSFYSRTYTATSTERSDIGIDSSGSPYLFLSVQRNGGGGISCILNSNYTNGGEIDNATNDSKCFAIASRTAANSISSYKDGVKVASSTYNQPCTLSPQYLLLFKGANGGFSNRECAFASAGIGLTDADAAALNSIVQAFQTTLGRQN